MTWDIKATGTASNIFARLTDAAKAHLEETSLPGDEDDQIRIALECAELICQSKAFGPEDSAYHVHVYGHANAEHVTADPDSDGPNEGVGLTVRLAFAKEIKAADDAYSTSSNVRTADAPEVDATPAAQAHAEELGVDLTQVEGTGAEGRITKADVAAAAEPAPEHAEGSPEPQVDETGKAVDPENPGDEDDDKKTPATVI